MRLTKSFSIAAIAAASVLALAGCTDSEAPGAESRPVDGEGRVRGGHHDGGAQRGGRHHDRHQVRPAAVRPRRTGRQPRGLRRRDRQDHRRPSSASHRTTSPGRRRSRRTASRSSSRARSTSSSRPTRSTTSARRSSRSPARTTTPARTSWCRGQPRGHRRAPTISRARHVCSVAGSTRETNLESPTGVTCCRPPATATASSRCATAQVVAVTTDNVILAGLADQNEGEFEVVGNPFTEEPYGIGLALEDDRRSATGSTTCSRQSYEDGTLGRGLGGDGGQRCSTCRTRRRSTATPADRRMRRPLGRRRIRPPDRAERRRDGRGHREPADLPAAASCITLALLGIAGVGALVHRHLRRGDADLAGRVAARLRDRLHRGAAQHAAHARAVLLRVRAPAPRRAHRLLRPRRDRPHRSTPRRSSPRRSARASTACPVGQAEAARSIGLGFGQTLGLVVLPQAIRMVIPPLINVLIALTKNTSVAGGFFVKRALRAPRRTSSTSAATR